jgi:hypothetical protein
MSRLQRFLRSVHSPFNMVVFVGLTVFAAVNVASWRGGRFPDKKFPPATAATHSGPTVCISVPEPFCKHTQVGNICVTGFVRTFVIWKVVIELWPTCTV